jgi:putative SOS response-associated peptidase YedK
MCGRVTVKTSASDLQQLFKLDGVLAAPDRPDYNLPPTRELPVVANGTRRELDLYRWGLVPGWAKDLKGPLLNNARAETIAEKRTFKSALERRRCLVLVDGFYEWRREGKEKHPFLIRRRDGKPMAFAGLWDQWNSPENTVLRSCTIITCGPNEAMKPVHDRMPVLLPQEAYDLWLSPEPRKAEELTSLLVPCAPDLLEVIAVSPLVNSVKNNSPECMAPLGVAPLLVSA